MPRAVIAVVAAAAALVVPLALNHPAEAAPESGTSSIGITKTVNQDSAQIGGDVTYTLKLACSNANGGCDEVVVKDVIPAGLTFTQFINPPSPTDATWTAERQGDGTTILLITYLRPVTAGNSPEFNYVAHVSNAGDVQPGDVLTNTVEMTSSNAENSPQKSSSSVPATQTAIGQMTATKTWVPNQGLEGVANPSTITVSGLNAGNRTVDTMSLVEPGATSEATFDFMDAVSVGGALPSGATAASLTVSFVGGPANLVIPAQISGTSYTLDPASLPAGKTFADLVSIKVTFTGALPGATQLGASNVAPGTLVVPVTQRLRNRTSGAALTSGSDYTIRNKADGSLHYIDDAVNSDCPSCSPSAEAPYVVKDSTPQVVVAKSNYNPNPVTAALRQTVSNTITATNQSPGLISEMSIQDPAINAPTNPFTAESAGVGSATTTHPKQLSLKAFDVRFPAGAQAGSMTLKFPDGSSQSFPVPGDTNGYIPGPIAGGLTIEDATGFALDFLATTPGSYITGAAAVNVYSTALDTVTPTAPGAGNCTSASVTSSVLGGRNATTAATCTPQLNAISANYGVKVTKSLSIKTAQLGTSTSTQVAQTASIVADSTPVTRVVIQDPKDSQLNDLDKNFFNATDARRIENINVPGDSDLTIQYYDSSDLTWKDLVSFASQPASSTYDIPDSIRAVTQGLRWVYTAKSTAFNPGRVFNVYYRAGLRPTYRDTGAPLDLVRKVPANCNQADTFLPATNHQANDALSPPLCPSLNLWNAAGNGVSVKRIPAPIEVIEQSTLDTEATMPANPDDSVVFGYLSIGLVKPAASVTFSDPGATAKTSERSFFRAMDVVRIGGQGYLAGATPGTLKPYQTLKLTKFMTADLTFTTIDGTTLPGTYTVQGSGDSYADALALSIDVKSAAASLGLDPNAVGGFEFTLRETKDASGNPLAGDPEPGQLEWEMSQGNSYDSGDGFFLPLKYQVRRYERTATLPYIDLSKPVLDEKCYDFDANESGALECPLPINVNELNNVGTEDEGFLLEGWGQSITHADGVVEQHQNNNPIDWRIVKIQPAKIDIQVEKTFSDLAPDGVPTSTDSVKDGVVPMPLDRGIAQADYPHATATVTAANRSDVPVNTMSLSDPSTPLPVAATTTFDYFNFVSAAISISAGTNVTATATLTNADGTTRALGPLSLPALASAINAEPNKDQIVGVTVAATSPDALPVSAVLTLTLDLQLRSTSRVSGRNMQDEIGAQSITVNNTGRGDIDSVVADDSGIDTKSVVVRAGDAGVAGGKSFNPTTGIRDTTPTTQVTLTARNSGQKSVDTMEIIDLDDADGPGATQPESGDISDAWDRFDFVSIDALTAPAKNGVAQANEACVTVATWDVVGHPVNRPCVVFPLTGTTFPITASSLGVAASDIRGISVTFRNSNGSGIAPGIASTDDAALKMTVRLRETKVSDGAPTPLTQIVNTIHTKVSIGTTSTQDSCAVASPPQGCISASYTPLPGTTSVDVAKYTQDSTGAYNQTNAVAQSGDVVPYGMVVVNNGTASMPVNAIDVPTPMLMAVPAATNGFDIDLTTEAGEVWTPLPASSEPTESIGADGTMQWKFPDGFVLRPGQGLRVRQAFQVSAGASGTVINTFGVDGLPASSACPIDRWNATGTPPSSCTATHFLVVTTRGGYIAEKLTMDNHGGTNVNEVGSTASCTVASDPGFSKYPCAAQTSVGGDYTTRLKLTNNSSDMTTRVVLGDRLPYLSDQSLTVPGAPGYRGSEWFAKADSFPVFERVTGLGAVMPIASSDVIASYTASTTPCTAVLQSSGGTCSATDYSVWSADAPPSGTTALLFAFELTGAPGSANAPLGPGETIRVTWTMKNPTDITGLTDVRNFIGAATPDAMLSSWNTFAYLGTAAGGTKTGETSKAGAILETGALQISKSLVNNTIAADSQWGPFTIGYSCVFPSDPTVVVDSGSFTMAKGDVTSGTPSVFIDPIVPVNSVCTITETNSGGADVVTPTSQQVTITSGAVSPTPASVSVRNQFDPVSLTVSKAVLGTPPAGTVFEFTTTCTIDGTPLTVTSPWTLPATGGTHVISGLPKGAICITSETDDGDADRTLVNGVLTSTPDTTSVTMTTNNVVTYSNAFGTNGLVVTKAVDSEITHPSFSTGPYTINVACTSDGTTTDRNFVLAAGESGTWDGLANGTQCVVTEPNSSGAHAVTITDNDSATAEGTILITGPAQIGTALVTNEFNAGEIEVYKNLVGTSGAETSWNFDVDCSWNGKTSRDRVAASPGTPGVVTGLPNGAVCSVAEVGSLASTTTYDPALAGDTSRSASVTIDGSAASAVAITATNSYLGTLNVAKTVNADPTLINLSDVMGRKFPITTTCFASDGTTALAGFPDTQNLGDTESHDYTNLPAGTSCTVVETDALGASATSISTSVGGAPAILTPGPSASLVIAQGSNSALVANEFPAAELEIRKELVGDPGAESTWTFDATCTWGVDQETTIRVAATAEEPGVVRGLPDGAECVVVEVGTAASKTTYSPAAEGPPGIEGDDSKSGVVKVSAGATEPVVVTVTNSYLGSLTVGKSVHADPALTNHDDVMALTFPITTTCVAADGTTTLAGFPNTQNLGDGKTHMYGDLPVGSSCTVVEDDARGAATTSVTASSAGAGAVMTPGLKSTVAIAQGKNNAMVTNDFPAKPVPPTKPPTTYLPPTGALVWPILAVAAFGIVLGGLVLIARRRRS